MLSNEIFFAVRDVPTLPAAGWSVQVCDHTNFATVVAVVEEYIELSIGPELSAPGQGSITLDAQTPFWSSTLLNGRPATDLLAYEYLWEAFEDGVKRFQWLGTMVAEKLLEPTETRAITISGPGAAQVLTWGCVLPKYFPPASDADHAGSYYWQFPVTWSSMRIWLKLLRVCQSRGTLRWIQPLFTDTADSGHQPWEVVQTVATVAAPEDGIRPEPGTNLLDLLNVHTGQDLTKQFAMRAEWYMWPGFRLDVRKVIGTARQDKVIFFEGGLNLKERTRVRDEIANYIVTLDQNGSSSFAVDTTSITHWNQREQLQNHNLNITDPARRTAIGRVFLEQRKDEKSQWVIHVPYDQPGRKVFTDYGIGDWIGISGFSAAGVSTVDAYRVLAIVVNVRDAVPTVELTLQSKLDVHQRDLQKQLTSILNAIGGGADTGSSIAPVPHGHLPDGTPFPDPSLSGSTGSGGTGGIRVFIQPDDPLDEAHEGDIWIITNY
jgi:hypothetical protein